MSIEISLLNSTISVVAKRNSGKSILIRYLVNSQKHLYQKIFVICPTEKINPFYNTITKDDCIFDQWNESWIEELIESMTKINANKSTKERKQN